MIEQWQELKETIIELRDNNGIGTQQEVCKFLANYMDILEKQMQQPCEDCTIRTEVIKSIDEREDVNGKVDAESVRTDIVLIPPVTPQPKMGRWIYGEDNLGTGRDGWYCNQCGHFEFWDYSSDVKSAKLNLPNPCPNCGAKMVESQGSEG